MKKDTNIKCKVVSYIAHLQTRMQREYYDTGSKVTSLNLIACLQTRVKKEFHDTQWKVVPLTAHLQTYVKKKFSTG